MEGKTGSPDIIDEEFVTLTDTKPEKVIDQTIIEALETKRACLKVAQLSDVGAVRTRNEDSCFIFHAENGGDSLLPLFGLYLVADGMGGHESGHLASKIASRVTSQIILEKIYLPLLTNDDPPDEQAILAMMEEAVIASHQAIYDPDPAHDRGTTLTVAVQLGRNLYVAHVGDSRGYLLANGELKTITNDHSLVQRLQDEGQLTPEEAENYQYRNILLRALGQEDSLEVDTYAYKLPRHGKLLLCSDGLCGLVKDAEILQKMNQPVDLRQISQELVDAALAAGGYDNITAVVVEFSL